MSETEIPPPLKVTTRFEGVVVGDSKFVPVIVTSWLGRFWLREPSVLGPLAEVMVGGAVISKPAGFVPLRPELPFVTVTSRVPSAASTFTVSLAVIWPELSTLAATLTPDPKETLVVSTSKFVPVMTTTRPLVPRAAVVGETLVIAGPAAGLKTVAFCTGAGVSPGFVPEIVATSAAEVTPSAKKPEATSTVIPETLRLVGPVDEALARVNDRTPGDSRIGALRTAPAATMNETVGVAWHGNPAGRRALS